MKSSDKRKSKAQSLTSALDFFAEAGLLKRVKRSGWWVAGIKDPESVAEHCFRTAIIAHYIAHLEAVDPYKTITMALFNDIHESRINDLHKMGHYYIDFKGAEKKVFKDQIRDLDGRVRDELLHIRIHYDDQDTPEAVVARDADILECLIQAKEHADNGHETAKKFMTRAPEHLKTKTAKELWKQAKSWHSHDWWENVVKFER